MSRAEKMLKAVLAVHIGEDHQQPNNRILRNADPLELRLKWRYEELENIHRELHKHEDEVQPHAT